LEQFGARFEEDVTSRLEELVELVGPQTCARADVKYVASLILL
jgi:hypothetical protein